jgi:glycosyltransferase involved in cell wall biosynthesis
MSLARRRFAVFTAEFPSKVSTFFARDILALHRAGIDVDVYSLYPHDPSLWSYVPAELNEGVLPRDRVHHASLKDPRVWGSALGAVGSGRAAIATASRALSTEARGGGGAFGRTAYLVPKTLAWARKSDVAYDHVLAYWGNYSATAALIFQRATGTERFSTFLHAGVDLYRPTPFLPRKLLAADNIVVVCDFNRRFLSERFPDLYPRIEAKIHLHHLGLDLAAMQYVRAGRHEGDVLAVGRLDPRKGFDFLIRAFAQLDAVVARRLTVIGEGPDGGRLRQLAAELGVADRVMFPGALPFDEVKSAMQQATILVHPSPDLGDAVPTVIKEAMAVGLPVIGTRVAGIPELLDDGRTGTLVEPADSTALADAMRSLLVFAAQRDKHAEAGRAFAESTFDMWRNGSRLAEVLTGAPRQREAVS